jgi:hypothetical protein
MANEYKLMIDCTDGPLDGTTIGNVEVELDSHLNTPFLDFGEDAAPFDLQLARFVFRVTDGAEIGKMFSVPALDPAAGAGGQNEITFHLHRYQITERIVDEANHELLCQAAYRGPQQRTLQRKPLEGR